MKLSLILLYWIVVDAADKEYLNNIWIIKNQYQKVSAQDVIHPK